ncbi:MAG: alkaline phosphatase, partial [Woeseiaceae bacterium]|nr:alkaline phosphatase [Woeseiaceae bacterium]
MPCTLRRAAPTLVALLLLSTGCATTPEQPAAPERARNVILFIGDGMGVSTVTAARIYDGQSRGETGEENTLSFERFPNVALVKTYNSNQQVPDSAGTATAMNTGVKTRAGVIGVGPAAFRRDCASARGAELATIADAAVAHGKDYGIVTTTRITHATPATVYAHLPERDWESDAYLTEAQLEAGCVDIARQFVG